MTRLKAHIRRSWRRLHSATPVYLAFVVFTFLVLLPVYWMTRSAFAASTDLIKLPLDYFPPLTLRNFATLFEQVPFGLYLRNSFLFAMSTTLATLLVSFLAAYAFARIRFPGSGVLMWILVLSMALPDIGTIVPLYRILKTLTYRTASLESPWY